MIKLQKPVNGELVSQIISYLKKKGEIRATLLSKLERRFCKSKSEFKVKKEDLISCLLFMMNERIVEIIIPEPFQINWEGRFLKNLKFLKDSDYLVRQFSNLNENLFDSYEKNAYFFDSRLLDFKNRDASSEAIKNLKFIIKKVPKIKSKIIIYYPPNSKPLNIYETFEGNYNIEFLDFKVNPEYNLNPHLKIEIPLDQQKSDLAIIQSYRKNYMCMYITLIESIHKAIMNVQKKKEKSKNYNEILKDLIRKFGYYCYMYVRSDWIDVKPNPYRWESFFEFFDLPLKVINLSFNNIRFFGRTFEFWIRFNYCIFIRKKFKKIILKLKDLGFEEFEKENYGDYIAIGMDHEIYEVCPSIEYFYFLNKYIFFYHLFYLFFHSFPYIEKLKPQVKFSEKEQKLYRIFLPVMESMLNVQEKRIIKKLIFKYYTFNANELEIIYHKFLLDEVKFIEKKMFSYFIIRYGKC